jgi:hypothetical protein
VCGGGGDRRWSYSVCFYDTRDVVAGRGSGKWKCIIPYK